MTTETYDQRVRWSLLEITARELSLAWASYFLDDYIFASTDIVLEELLFYLPDAIELCEQKVHDNLIDQHGLDRLCEWEKWGKTFLIRLWQPIGVVRWRLTEYCYRNVGPFTSVQLLAWAVPPTHKIVIPLSMPMDWRVDVQPDAQDTMPTIQLTMRPLVHQGRRYWGNVHNETLYLCRWNDQEVSR